VDQTHPLLLDELEDRVEQIFIATEDLREAIGDGKTSRQLLESIFRNVHSLKAAASSNNLNDLTRIAHEFENLLHSLRVGRIILNDSVLQAFDETTDAMYASIRDEPAANQQSHERLFQRLQRLSAPTDLGSSLEVEVVLNAVPAEIWQALSEEEKHRLEQAVGEGPNLFLVNTRFNLASFDQLFQSLKDKLTENGEVISTAPKVDNELPDTIDFRILYTRESDLENVQQELAEFVDVTVSEIAPQPLPLSNLGHEGQLRYLRRSKAASPFIRIELNDLDKLISTTQRLFRETTACFDRAFTNAAEPAELLAPMSQVSNSFMELAAELVNLRMVQLDRVLQRAFRAGRSAAAAAKKEVDFTVVGHDLRIDKSLADAIADPLVHLVRNAVDHGIEIPVERTAAGKNRRGEIRIEASTRQGQIHIRVIDNGRGIDSKLVCSAGLRLGVIPDGSSLSIDQSLRLLFKPGFSTKTNVSETSGRGVGLDVVEAAIEDLGGAIRVNSELGAGSTFEIRLPATFGLLDVIVVKVGKHRYLIDATQVVSLERETEHQGDENGTEASSSFRLDKLLGLDDGNLAAPVFLHCNFEVQHSDQQYQVNVEVNDPIEIEQVLVRNLGSRGGRWFGIVGAAEMRDGTVALLLDLPTLVTNGR